MKWPLLYAIKKPHKGPQQMPDDQRRVLRVLDRFSDLKDAYRYSYVIIQGPTIGITDQPSDPDLDLDTRLRLSYRCEMFNLKNRLEILLILYSICNNQCFSNNI